MNNNKRGFSATQLQGQAGVWRVASELALRGFHPHFPGVDFGYDILLDHGIRVQVKCAHLRVTGSVYSGQGAYWFKFWKQPILSATNVIRHRRTRVFSETSDFVVLWGIEQNRFWIVPSPFVDNKQLVVVGPDVWYRGIDLAEVDRLVSEGLPYEEIARRVGVSYATISRRCSGQFREPKLTVSSQVRACENKWDLIAAAVEDRRGTARFAESPKPLVVINEAKFLQTG